MTVDEFEKLLKEEKPVATTSTVQPRTTTTPPIHGRIRGSSFCFTGTMSMTRTSMEREVSVCGGIVKQNVTKDLTYLVAEFPRKSNSTKIKQAREYGVSVISENKFWSLF